MLLNQVSKLIQEASTHRGGHCVPGTAIKGPACRSYGSVDILFLTLGNMGHDLTRRGIVDREGFA